MDKNEQNKIVAGCLKGKRKAHAKLYDAFKDAMFGICLRYANSESEANDMLQEGFITVFAKLEQFEGNGALPAWIKKVIVHSALGHLRKNKKHTEHHVTLDAQSTDLPFSPESNQSTDDLLYLIQNLPEEYRTVFNLFSIEGYSHKEVAEMLEISVANSKVRLMRAKEVLKQQVTTQKMM
ncbi:RNA polymerase sigma factor [Roseivirga sp.]|uniref:RNA polymerase sigma factor n=1 Tax=Roseivirga sp. TaxID=1964215 RepID=UPI003B8CF559